jgi:maltoporin
VNPVNNATEALATAYFVWNPVDCFSLGLWANWEYNDQGFQPVGVNTNQITGVNSRNFHGKVAAGSRNLVTLGIRPVYWICDNFAIQGAAAGVYIDNVRNSSGTPAFGKDGAEGIFTIAPTIKPKGGFFTRPEIRVFATYALWSHSLQGTSASGGNPPYNGRTNQGWLIGSQMEIWF